MIINVIATGSSGNLYEIIDSAGNCFILEAGEPRQTFIKNRESKIENQPEMCIISHNHSDHAKWANEYEMICPVFRWEKTAESANFKAFGYQVPHGDILNYAYLIKSLQDEKFVFFATDLEYSEEHLKPIFDDLRKYNVRVFLLEVNYNDFLYHKANEEQRRGCNRHFSDNDAVRFLRALNLQDEKFSLITIHGSNRLSGNAYVKKYIKRKFPNAEIGIAVGAKGRTKDLFNV